jgi:hypothetical protein
VICWEIWLCERTRDSYMINSSLAQGWLYCRKKYGKLGAYGWVEHPLYATNSCLIS